MTDDLGRAAPPTTSTALQPNVASLLAYLFGWVGGLVVHLTQHAREARFHAAQSILLSGAVMALYIALTIVGAFMPGVVQVLLSLVSLVVSLGFLGLWIYMMIQGYGLKHTKLPIIGDLAEQWAAK